MVSKNQEATDKRSISDSEDSDADDEDHNALVDFSDIYVEFPTSRLSTAIIDTLDSDIKAALERLDMLVNFIS